MVESLIFIEAGAGVGAGEKNTRSRSKADQLRNTGCNQHLLHSAALTTVRQSLNWALTQISRRFTQLSYRAFKSWNIKIAYRTFPQTAR